jgi:hypothetical protein
MKPLISILSIPLAATALIVLTGCQSVSTSHTQAIGVPKYPPTDPAQVQILRTEPTRSNVKLGQVRAEPSSESVDVTKIETALKTEAAKLGADAAVVVYDQTKVVGAEVVGGWLDRSVEPIEGRVVVAVAIKYQ